MEILDQSAIFIISSIETPNLLALEVEALLVECALNLFVSMPELDITFFIQLLNVVGDNCL